MNQEGAVDSAIKDCIGKHILEDFQGLTSWLKAAARSDSLEEFQKKTGLNI